MLKEKECKFRDLVLPGIQILEQDNLWLSIRSNFWSAVLQRLFQDAVRNPKKIFV